MNRHNTRRWSIGVLRKMILSVGIALCIVGLVTSSNPCFAQRLYKPELVLPSNYPEWFHGFGRIGLITEDRVVINDFNFRLSPYVKFHTPTEQNVSRAKFKPRMMVGFLFDVAGEITSMWLLKMK